MTFKVIYAALFGALMATPALAEDVEFRGSGLLKSNTTQCRQAGFDRTNYARFRYNPANLGGNPNEGRLTVFFDFYAMSYTVPRGFTSNYQMAGSAEIGRSFGLFVLPAHVKMARTDPRRPSANTKSLRIVGDIRNFANVPGCVMRFDAPLFRGQP